MPLLIIPIIILTIGLGFIISILNGVVRDVGNMISVIMAFLLFLTPVLYSKPSGGMLARITEYNPLYYLVSVPRELILMNTVSEWNGFFASTLFAIAVFVICLLAFHLTETRVTERV